jgi:hypothetical protein
MSIYPNFESTTHKLSSLASKYGICFDKVLSADVSLSGKCKRNLYYYGALVANLAYVRMFEDGSNFQNNYADCTSKYYPELYKVINPGTTEIQYINPDYWQGQAVGSGYQQYMCPQWGSVDGCGLNHKNVSEYLVKGPYTYECDTKKYKEQADQIIKYTSHLDDKQKVSAEFWHKGFPALNCTPAEMWIIIAFGFVQKYELCLEKSVILLFSLSACMFNAFIACWCSKRHWNAERPTTAIRYLYNGKIIKGLDGNKIYGNEWKGFINPPPPFATLSSGHSTCSASASECLRLMLGSDSFFDEDVQIDNLCITSGNSGLCKTSLGEFIFAPHSGTVQGDYPCKEVKLKFKTLSEAAENAGISRLYGGIHFEIDNIEGLKCGRNIAKDTLSFLSKYCEL